MDVDSDESEDEDLEELRKEEEEFEEMENAMKSLKDFSFKSVRQGDTVVVAYEEDFHVGVVEEIVSDSLADVNFYEHCSIRSDAFRWPLGRPDRATVNSKFVLSASAEMNCKSNGRMWTLQKYNFYELLYMEFCRVYFD